MTDNNLRLKKVNELLDDKYYVPAYQRGFRWTEDEVKALLKDVWDFRENPPKQEEGEEKPFYCLQPIVVKVKHIDKEVYCEVIDGQQRLTTLRIILNYFNLTEYSSKPKKLFGIDYQTRPNCKDFFNDIENTVLAEENIDFSHMHEAHKTIDKWFTAKEVDNDSIRHDFRSSLINDVKVIWYETKDNSGKNEDSASIDIFTRLNIGKIPLTNAELVKALFLQKGNFQKDKATLKQLQIAAEWDAIEKMLQNDAFWFFIYNPDNPLKYDNRIEYIFDLMQNKTKEHEIYHTFNKFHKEFVNSKKDKYSRPDIDTLWLKIKKYYLSFEEWYNDKTMYHLIGFLIEYGFDIRKLKLMSQKKTKSDFKIWLKEKIKERVSYQVDELSYGNKEVRKILLLFNIQTILATENTDIKFPFSRYKDEDWDIEHIRSQTDKTIAGGNRKDWVLDVLEYFTGFRLHDTKEDIDKQEKAIKLLENEDDVLAAKLLEMVHADEIDDEEFSNLYNEIAVRFDENTDFENKDSIGNLALLDAKTNRSYGNAMFPIKRNTIIKNDMNGIFVPLCTKNVFLKSYSKKLGEVMYWGQNDTNDYLTAIKDTLKDYLPPQEEQDDK